MFISHHFRKGGQKKKMTSELSEELKFVLRMNQPCKEQKRSGQREQPAKDLWVEMSTWCVQKIRKHYHERSE